MATWKEERKKYENEGVTYLKQIVKQGWEVTPTVNPYTAYDATVTKGDMSFKVENKVRRYDLDKLDTIYLAKKKLDPGVKYYVEHFPRNSTSLVITYEAISKGIEDGNIEIKKITVPKGQFKYESGVDTTMECLANLVIPKSLFHVYPIVPAVTACTAQADRQRNVNA